MPIRNRVQGQICLLILIVSALLLPGSVRAKGRMEALALEIISPGDTSDRKMAKIEAWTRMNIQYVPDIVLYGKGDVAYHPSVTVRKGKADCEDGALLTQALAAYGGIPMNRVRTLLTIHSPTQGHAWNLYKRESDNQWVPVDWTWSGPPALNTRPPLPGMMPFSRWHLIAYYIVKGTRPFKRTFVRLEKAMPLFHFENVNALDRLLRFP